MATYKNPLENANAIVDQVQKRPKSTTPEQMEHIRNSAIKEFGLTNRFQNAIYLLPNGQMLDGTGGQRYGRAYDHRDINSAYLNNKIELDEEKAGNTTNMLDFMRAGNIRLVPETNSIDLMAKPTPEQQRAILNFWRLGKLDSIQITNPNDDYGQQLDYLEDIQKESQILNLLKKYYGD